MNNHVWLIYPPGDMYQRGEDRCQGSIDKSSATSMRAANDLGYAASVLKQSGYDVFLKDYQTEKLSMQSMEDDLRKYKPSIVMVSVTNATIFDDIKVASKIKNISGAKIILKGAIFFDASKEVLDELDLSNIDFLIGGEVEFSIGKIADYLYENKGKVEEIPNIFFKNQSSEFIKTRFGLWEQDLDSIPFPDRELMNNSLYVRPDTGEAMATIQTSRGCSAACTYCLSPIISGKKIRHRSPENVLKELEDCYFNHGIKNFFFKSDTFTMNKDWVISLCKMIISSPLNGKIAFTANSRTNPLSLEALQYMKQAGCFMVAYGFESGSDETLIKIKKGATASHNLNAAKITKKAKLPFYGFFMIGFPWETKKHLEATKKHIFEINPDFLEIHIVLPYYGTEFYDTCQEHGTLKKDILGSNYFESGIIGTETLTIEELTAFRDSITKKFYLRPTYLFKKLFNCIKNPQLFPGYFKYGYRLLRNLFRRQK